MTQRQASREKVYLRVITARYGAGFFSVEVMRRYGENKWHKAFRIQV